MKRKFNVVDICLILLIAAAVVVCLLFLRQRGTIASETQTDTMRVTVELREVQPETLACFTEGMDIYRSTDSVHLGTLAEVRSEPYTAVKYSQLLERYVTYECEGIYRVYLTIEAQGYETAQDVIFNGISVHIGDEIYIKGKGCAGAGYITGIDTMAAPQVENTALSSGDTPLTYTIRIGDIRAFTAEAIHVDDRVYDPATGALLGVVKEIESRPYYTYEVDAAGSGLRAEKPDRVELVLRLESACIETNESYFIDGKNELKLGGELVIATKYVKCEMRYYELLNVG